MKYTGRVYLTTNSELDSVNMFYKDIFFQPEDYSLNKYIGSTYYSETPYWFNPAFKHTVT